MTINKPPNKPLFSTKVVLAIGIACVVIGIVWIIFFPNAQ